MKILIFPNDPLIAYLKKGELKERYFNPNNIFEEIHFITFADEECNISDIQITIGNAKGFIHKLNKFKMIDMFFPYRRLKEIFNIVDNIKIDIIRGYSSTYSGYFTIKCAKHLNKKSIISLHTNFDDMRYQYKKRKDYLRFFKYIFTKKFIEKKVLKTVNSIIAKYAYTKKYALDNGANNNKIELIYNKIPLNKFYPLDKKTDKKTIKVICVGNLEIGKGQRVLIDSIPLLNKNIYFTFVGDGEDYNLLVQKVKSFKIEDQVTFIKSIPNEQLAGLYREHDIFSLPIQYGGICIPALEATASGLALVMPKPIHEDSPEITGEYAMIVENTPEGFANGIQKIANNNKLKESIIIKGLKVIQNYSGDIMEQKETNLYKRVING